MSTSSVYSNRITLSGLISGIDTEAVVKKLLTGEQTKLDRLKQQQQILEWKKEAYRDINAKLLAVRNALADMKLSATYNAKKVASSDEKTVTATANGDAVPGTYSIKVKQVAQRVSYSSTAALGSSGDKSSIATQFGLDNNARIKFTIKGKDGEIAFDFKAGDTNMDEIVRAINNQDIGLNAFYDSGVDRFFLSSNDFGSTAEISVKVDSLNGTGSFLNDILKMGFDYGTSGVSHTVTSSSAIAATPPADTALLSSLYGGTETVPSTVTFSLQGTGATVYNFSFNTATTTIADLVNGINAQTATTGITAGYNPALGAFALICNGPIAVRADDQEFLGSKLNLVMDENKGTSCKIDYNGATDLEFDSNNFTLNNINFKIDHNAVAGTPVTLTVTNDTEQAVTKIKAFVDAYNKAIEAINGKLMENRPMENHAVKYMPLTDAQKEAMSEDQISAWETKAKMGIMKNESVLRTTLANLRSIASSIIGDKVADANVKSKDELVDYVESTTGQLVSNCKYRSLAAIGITGGIYASGNTDNGKLNIDEDTLRAALESNADDVKKLFTLTQTDITATSTVTYGGENYTRTLNYNIGIAAKMYEGLTDTMSEITNKAGSNSSYYDNSKLGQDIYRFETRIAEQEERMYDLEDRYYARFTNMEKVLGNLSSQSAWLAQQLGNNSSS
ncbi:MAG: flagellar filament capping protein FliD [Syntrophomonadaceae bacterium]|nr:flagellar filament capping protein FliD [Syntrophomonadaceae bacterium]